MLNKIKSFVSGSKLFAFLAGMGAGLGLSFVPAVQKHVTSAVERLGGVESEVSK